MPQAITNGYTLIQLKQKTALSVHALRTWLSYAIFGESFLPQIVDVQGISMGVNVGCGKIRFPMPVKVGSRVRGSGEVVEAKK
jgi:acyl dehydratase